MYNFIYKKVILKNNFFINKIIILFFSHSNARMIFFDKEVIGVNTITIAAI